jgi:hypothetical protein
MLRTGWPFGASLLASSALRVLCYLTMIAPMRRLGIAA